MYVGEEGRVTRAQLTNPRWQVGSKGYPFDRAVMLKSNNEYITAVCQLELLTVGAAG